MKPGEGSHEEVRRVAEGLKRKVQESGLPYRVVEERAGIGRDYLRQVLRGSVKLRLEHVFAILDALGVPPADFFTELYGPPTGEHPAETSLSAMAPQDLVALLQRTFGVLQEVFGPLRLKGVSLQNGGTTMHFRTRDEDDAGAETPGELPG